MEDQIERRPLEGEIIEPPSVDADHMKADLVKLFMGVMAHDDALIEESAR